MSFLYVLNQAKNILYFLKKNCLNGRTFGPGSGDFNYVCNKSVHFVFTNLPSQNLVTRYCSRFHEKDKLF